MKPNAFSCGAVLSLTATLLLSACAASSSPRSDQAFGQSVRAITAQQTLNPQGADPTKMTRGMDGDAASRAQQNYLQSFSTPAEPAQNSLDK